ncbi:MAG: 4-hydroxyphenylpyruvate dioxygenase [Pleurocapsa sp. CRU_1_2]|nr:4-hydroxyphenylpyruvate dioxygenase [Pleurocapsa sp. CRU_1_2]
MKIDHVHFYTRNAARTKDWFIGKVGFQAIGNCISQHTQTELIALNSAYFVISSPLNSASPVAQYLNHHPEGVADVAFRVKNLAATIERSRRLGVKTVQNIQLWRSSLGKFKFAQITGWQDLQHTLIEETGQPDCCIPIALKPYKIRHTSKSSQSNLTQIDHIVLNVAQGKLDPAVKLYQELFNFEVQQSFKIQTSSSGLTSQALIDDEGEVQFNINQPTTANSQIQEFIDVNRGSGIQHLALRSQNLIADVAQLQQKLKFLTVPQTYYDSLKPLLFLNVAERTAIIQQQILVDSDRTNPQSLLMQIFTQPIFEQPTFFLELIERRHSAQGFGQGNFQALFEAVERQSKHLPPIHNHDRTTMR